MKKQLIPTIQNIKENLFSPSEKILMEWLNTPESLDKEVLKHLNDSEYAQQYKKDYQNLQQDISVDKEKEKPIPSHILELINRRCEASKQGYKEHPQEGQIVLVQKIIEPNKSIPFGFSKSLAILLDTPVPNSTNWNAWVVSSETDYASLWDMVLEPDIDSPLDPQAGMIQVWNQISLDTSLIIQTIGTLKPERLNVLRSLAKQYQNSLKETENLIPSQAGLIAIRWINELSLLTGTPISKTDDPRLQYQSIFKQVGELFHSPASIKERPTIKDWFQNWFDQLQVQLNNKQASWSISGSVNYAMGDDSEQNLILDDYLQIQFNPQLSEGSQLIHILIRQKKKCRLSIEYFEDDYLEHHTNLSRIRTETSFLCNPLVNSRLVIKDENEETLHSLSLKLE